MVDSFLTEKQKKVLELREKGKTQKEISNLIDTSRSNISLIEKRARENISKSKKTLEEYKKIISPINIKVKEGEDVLEVPKKVFEKANKNEIKVKLDTVEIIEKIEQNENVLLDNRVARNSFIIYITDKGDVLVEENDSV